MIDLDSAIQHTARWRQRGLTIGFTNGCFDLLHPGHVSLLAQARAACDRLIVGLNSDASTRRLKGEGRPIQPEASRAAVLASLANVDLVVAFDEDTPLKLIEALRPDVLVKGADYARDEVVGAELVERRGGKLILVELAPGHSTSGTIGLCTKEDTLIEIWFVQDYLSGKVLENKHYSEKVEAVNARNRLGYGLVKCHRLQNGGVIKVDGTRRMADI